jgi:hypothetical protein
MRGAALKHGSAILMARFAANSGGIFRRQCVEAINYSLYELGKCHEGGRRISAGLACSKLNADDVFFESLQMCNLWTADRLGYNFRHEIDMKRLGSTTAKDKSYLVQYEITPVFGPRTNVGFQLRVIST